MSTSLKRRLFQLIPLAFLLLAVANRVIDPSPVQKIRAIVFDTYLQLSPRPYDPGLPVKIIDIDNESLKRIGQWPWPRPYISEMVGRLSQAGAAAIAFDMVFAELDRSSPEEALKIWPATLEVIALKESVAALPSHDTLFAEAIGQARVVSGFVMTHEDAEAVPAKKAGIAIAGDDPKPFLRSFSNATLNLERIEEAATGNGAFNSVPDFDNIIRRMPLLFRLDGEIYPSLAAEALRVAQGARSYVVKSSGASGETAFGEKTGINTVKIGQFEIPTDANGAVAIRYDHSRRERYISAWEVLENDFDPQRVAGQILFLGTSAPGLLDIRSSPLNPIIPGVEIHAQLLEQILSGDYLYRPDYANGLETIAILILGLLMILLLRLVAAGWVFVIGGVMTASIVYGSWHVYTEYGWMFDPVYPTIMAFMVFAAQTTVSFLQSESEKKQVRDAFSHYLSPAMVERLASDPSQLKLGGERRTMTVLFTDIRGFTGISEQYKDDPEGLTSLINRFLTPQTRVVLENQGTIDKYMGDALMAFWNAPLPDDQHAAHACQAALDMLQELDHLNSALKEEQSETSSNPAAETEAAARESMRAQLPSDQLEELITLVPQDRVEERLLNAAKRDIGLGYLALGLRCLANSGDAALQRETIFWLQLAAEKGQETALRLLETLDIKASDKDLATVVEKIEAWKSARMTSEIRLRTGVGIGTGECVVGNVGSELRFDYSVLGDSVNLASRLEGQTKTYGVAVIVDQTTRDGAPEIPFLEIDLIAVKGKQQAERIYALLGDKEMAESSAYLKLSENHGEMLKAYRTQDWEKALRLIAVCEADGLAPLLLYQLYRARIHLFQMLPPPADWDGVYVATSK